MPGDSASYALRGRLGGLRRAALYDGLAVTTKARAAYAASFLDGHECAMCAPIVIPSDLPEPERLRRAEAARRFHFANLSYRSAKARKAPSVADTEGAKEVTSGSSTTPTP